jgi:hypothetical protein
MKTAMFAVVCLLAAGATAPARAATEAELCKFMKDTATGFAGKGPHMVDKVTRADGASADCGTKSASFRLSILLDSSKLKPGWQDTLKAGWSQSFCRSATLKAALAAGWRAGVTWTTSDSVSTSADTTCP